MKAAQKALKESKFRIIPKDQIKEMKQLHAAGKSYKEIAAKFGRSKTGVFKVINDKRSEKYAFRYKPILWDCKMNCVKLKKREKITTLTSQSKMEQEEEFDFEAFKQETIKGLYAGNPLNGDKGIFAHYSSTF